MPWQSSMLQDFWHYICHKLQPFWQWKLTVRVSAITSKNAGPKPSVLTIRFDLNTLHLLLLSSSKELKALWMSTWWNTSPPSIPRAEETLQTHQQLQEMYTIVWRDGHWMIWHHDQGTDLWEQPPTDFYWNSWVIIWWEELDWTVGTKAHGPAAEHGVII